MIVPAAPALSASPYSAAWFVGLHNNGPAVFMKLGSIENVLGRGFNVDFDTLAGLNVNGQTPFGGFALVKPFGLASNVDAFAGLGWITGQGRPSDVGLAAGVSVRF